MAEEITNQDREIQTDKEKEVESSGHADLEAGIGSQASEEMAESQAPEETAESKVPEEITNNHIAQKRGRMVAAGLIASVILAVVAVTVAGIFQLTSAWLIKCPSDLPVNDPAPILWKDVESKEVKSAPLGVPERLLKQASWKGSAAAKETSSEESK
jgi:hypothetical protein